MAFVLWRAAMKKYTAVKWEIKRNHIGLIVPTKKSIKAYEDPPAIATTSASAIAIETLPQTETCDTLCSVNPSSGSLEEILTHQYNGSSDLSVNLPRVDVRKSRSKMKSYLKRCKDKLIGAVADDQFDITHHEAVTQSPSTSWYLDETEELDIVSPIVVTTLTTVAECNQPPDVQSDVKSEYSMEVESLDGDDCTQTDTDTGKPDTETASLSEVQVIYDCSVENLVDRYLGHLYPDYLSDTRIVLVRQARDILVLSYHGDVSRFEHDYLSPAAEIVERLRLEYMAGWNQAWYNGWPLAISGAVVLHLGSLDESLLRHHEIYLCIRTASDQCGPKLYAVWRTPRQSKIVYHPLDPDKEESVSPTALEMLAEDLPQLLQSLLASVEREICRVPLDDLPFPNKDLLSRDPTVTDENGNGGEPQPSIDNRLLLSPTLTGSRRLECGLKRRELVTKNKTVNSKYALKRMASVTSGTDDEDKSEIDIQSRNMKNELICGGDNKHLSNRAESIALPPQHPTILAPGSIVNVSVAAAATTTITTAKPPATLIDGGVSKLNGETTIAPAMPLFCLGGSFPHIDSDEESCDDTKKTETVSRLPHDIVAPRSIQDVPQKMLMSGILLLGTEDTTGHPVITIQASDVVKAGLNCYEIATVLLYYNTIPLRTTTFTVNLIVNELNHLNILDLLDASLQLINDIVKIHVILVTGAVHVADKERRHLLTKCLVHVKYGKAAELKPTVTQHHDQKQWIEFFTGLEPLREQCLTVGGRLVTALADIRVVDAQGTTTRRQLHSQHRALSRALMDTELQSLRRKGPGAIARLQERAARIKGGTGDHISTNTNTLKTTLNETKNSSTIQTEIAGLTSLNVDNNMNTSVATATITTITTTTTSPSPKMTHENDFVETRLNSVIMLFSEVDRSAKRLEQITEQRRERLREMTRQRALEDEMNEVIAWFKNDGNQSLGKYEDITLECGDTIKKHEQEFEKFYFISMKYLAKAKDLHAVTKNIEPLQTTATDLRDQLRDFGNRLQELHERIESACRLHQLLDMQPKDEDAYQEMQKLAERIGVPALAERCRQVIANSINSCKKELVVESLEFNKERISATSTPEKGIKKPPITPTDCHCWQQSDQEGPKSVSTLPPLIEDTDLEVTSRKQLQTMDEDEEDHSKMADSGLGGCDRCEGNEKLTRACSCQSFEDATLACGKSNNSDDMDEDCFENSNKASLDLQVPLQTNAHLYCHASTLQLDMEDSNFLDQKTKKTLLLIMREMIGTERDYVRSLYYVIENYTKELLREDIPQAMRGQRNVIFGNIEKIYEFHQQHFLTELESCEHDPLKIGAVFLRHESKFYLYALYNKNKPKSDSLMSEYGTVFFKSKQMELADKMDLASYLLKPVQRMGKYALLLQQLMKACNGVQTGTSSQEFLDDLDELQKAEEMVRFQLRHGNDLLAMDSLRDCDVNVKEQGRLLRQSEFLVWEGKGGKKSIRQVFLFEELVLFSKARRFPDRKNLDIYIYKNSIKTSDIGLTAHVGDSKTKFEIWFRKRKPGDTWTLQCISEDVKNAWANEITNLLWNQAKRNREIRMAEMSSMGIGSKPCLDIRPSIDQINDRSISIFQLGKAPKFRNSFMGTLPEMKSTRRPNSIISLSSSSSSAGSSVSNSTGSSCGASLVSGENKHNTSSNTSYESSLIHHHVAGSKCNKHHHRSTTIVSQCSMESGIIADISSFSPDEYPDNPMWPTSLIKKSNSTSSADQNQKSKTKTNNSNTDTYLTDSITVHL